MSKFSKSKYILPALLCFYASFDLSSVMADDYQSLIHDVDQQGMVNVIVSGEWQAVTGDINPADYGSAITGAIDIGELQSEFISKISQGGAQVEQDYRFKYLPFAALHVDAIGLKNIKNVAAHAMVWKNETYKASLMTSTKMIGANAQWAMGGTGKGQIIAIVDSGVDSTHPMVAGRVIYEACIMLLKCEGGKSMVIGAGAAKPSSTHGTHVAGIAAGDGDGLRGVAPEADIVAIKVLGKEGGKFIDSLIALDVIYRLVVEKNMPIAVVNFSLGSGHHTQPCSENPFSRAALFLKKEGVAIVAASGNEGFTDALSAPACGDDVISVGAVDKNWNVAGFSNSADFLDIVAPGADILSSVTNVETGGHSLEAHNGTSMAAPHVAGAFAVMKQLYPKMSIDDILDHLKGSLVRDQKNNLSFPTLGMTINPEPNDDSTPTKQPAETGVMAITG